MNADRRIRFFHYTYMPRHISIVRHTHFFLSDVHTLSYKYHGIDWDCRHYDLIHNLKANHANRNPDCISNWQLIGPDRPWSRSWGWIANPYRRSVGLVLSTSAMEP